ncbi:hypothetical protein [Microbulbifer sp. TYP-18]|uniref:hypothetical protein n=1 Tax=Microbulbifer sp. TYP-18 TaxID=3230024 RepID=UPI0034C5F4F5
MNIAALTSDGENLISKLNEKLEEYSGGKQKSLIKEMKKFYTNNGDPYKFDSSGFDLVLIQYWAEWCTWCGPHTNKMQEFISKNQNYKFLWIQAESS